MEMDIEAQVRRDLEVITRNVMEWAENLLREYLEIYVYRWGELQKSSSVNIPIYHDDTKFKPKRYWQYSGTGHATGQTLHSITHDAIHEGLENYVGYMIYSDPRLMQHNSQTSLHGTRTGADYRATMLERLNDSYDDWTGKARNRWWTRRPKFFDMYLDRLDAEIYPRFEAEMRKVGMDFVKTGAYDADALM